MAIISRQDSPRHRDEQNEVLARRWLGALALTLAEPVLAVCPFSCVTASHDAGSLPAEVILALTPITVRVYPRLPSGDIDATRELAVCNRASVRATISRRKLAVALSLTEADGHGIKLYATSDAPCDAFIRLVQHTVRA